MDVGVNLFGCGAGCSTCGDFTCSLCKTKYNEGNDVEENYSGCGVVYTEFAGLNVCYACFDAIEQEVLQRMGDIIPWYKGLVDRKSAELEKERQLLEIACSITASQL